MIWLRYKDVGVKSPQLCCLRIVPCVTLPQSSPVFAYRGIIIPLLCSYLGGSQGLSSTYEQAHVDLDLLTLASYKEFAVLTSQKQRYNNRKLL